MRRVAAFLLLLGLLSSLVVAVERLRVENQARRVELTMDYNDFVGLARAFNYKPNPLLLQFRRAGLTSLALTEELGGNLAASLSHDGYAVSGAALTNQARILKLANPTLASLAAQNKLNPSDVYLIVFD